MRSAAAGRAVFGGSAIFFGAIALAWHDPQTWQTLFRIRSVPLGALAGDVLMLAQVVGGIALITPKTARAGAVLLGVVYALFAIICASAIAAAPRSFDPYDSFFEQVSLVSGALALLSRSAIARIGLACSAASFAVAQIVYFRFTAELVPAWIPPSPTFWAAATTLAFVLAALALLLDRRAALAARAMALMTGIFAVLVWIPRMIAHPNAHTEWSEGALTLLITGAALCVGERCASELSVVDAIDRPEHEGNLA